MKELAVVFCYVQAEHIWLIVFNNHNSLTHFG